MIRVAAVGDIHLGEDARGTTNWNGLAEHADVLLVAGDLTRVGAIAEAEVAAAELGSAPVPVVCVLGNHDCHRGEQAAVTAALRAAGVTVLEGDACTVTVRGATLGIAGVKGFGGGFAGRCASAFGEPEMKAFVESTSAAAEGLRRGLCGLHTDHRVALLHYAPVPETLDGEPCEIYPFLGSYLLAEAADDAGADLIVHGHAHSGCERGRTPGGIPVRNVAQPVIKAPYAVYRLDGSANSASEPGGTPGSPAPQWVAREASVRGRTKHGRKNRTGNER